MTPGSWETSTLGKETEKIETVDPRKSPEEEFQYVDVSSVSNETLQIVTAATIFGKDAPSRARRRIRTDDVLFATIRPTLRRIALVPESLDNQVCSTGYYVLRAKERLEPRFIFYHLQTQEFMERMESLQSGASYPAVNDGHMRETPIPLPPLSEQRQIVSVLDAAFAGLATATAHTQKNLQNARELFDSKFQFALDSLSAETPRLTLEQLRESGWIADHMDGNHGGDYPRKSEFIDSGVSYLSANAMVNDGVNMAKAKFLSQERAGKLRKGFAKDGDVLFAHNATVGPVAILHTDEPFVVLGTSLTYYRCNPDYILPEYLAHYMRSRSFVMQYEQVMGQSTRNQVPITKQREFFHVIPPLEEQKRIASQLDDLLESTVQAQAVYRRKLAALSELKQSLLHRAFRGELSGNSHPSRILTEATA